MPPVSPLPARHVRHLRLRAADPDAVRPGATVIEEALRTASLPMTDHNRVLLIRRLDLGRIPRLMPSSSVALHVERVVGDIAARAASFDLPGVADRDAVVFPSRAEAFLRLARAHARRQPTSQWFWPMLIPGWGAGRKGNWLRLLDAVHRLPEAPVAAAAVAREAIDAHAIDDMLSAVHADRPRLWLRAAGWESAPLAGTSTDTPGLRRFVTRSVLRLGRDRFPSEDHWVWLLTLLAIGEQPARAGDPHLPACIRGCLVTASQRRLGTVPHASPSASAAADNSTTNSGESLRSTEDENHRSPDRSSTSPQADGQPRTPGSGTAVELAAANPTATDRIEHATVLAATDPLASRVIKDDPAISPFISPDRSHVIEQDADSMAEPNNPVARSSPGAGLFFLVPILVRLDFARWLADRPAWLESDFPARLLRFIGERVGLATDDPAIIALEFGRPSASFNSPPHTGVAPDLASAADIDLRSALPTPARALMAEPEPRGQTDTAFVAWHCVVRRWCRRKTGMGLISLVRRGGRLSWSRTHIEVWFDLSQIDLRLRRLALDVDPGWVPWLGRVVQFHYVDPNEHHR